MGRRKAARDPSEGWETGSTSTTYTTCMEQFNSTPEEEHQDAWAQAVDDLFEKRGSTREKALAALLAFMREDVRQEDAANTQVTLISRCVNSVRRGSNTESVLAAHVLGTLLITLPEPSESQFREVQGDLQRATTSGATADVRVAAVDSLAMCCFVAAEDDVCCQEVMAHLASLWSAARDPRTCAAALRGWALLFARLYRVLGSSQLEGLLGRLAGLLHAQDVEVRSAAGEVLALLYHCNLREMLEEYADLEEQQQAAADTNGVGEEEGDEEQDGEGMQANLPQEGTALGKVVGRMRELAAAHHHPEPLRRSKKDKAVQRATFRGVLAVVEAGQVPTVKVKLQGDVLVVDTMKGNVILSAVKKYLAGGFQTHLARNPQLHDWFDFTPKLQGPQRLSALEKRHIRSPSSQDSKWRTSERKGARAYKASRHAAHIQEDF